MIGLYFENRVFLISYS